MILLTQRAGVDHSQLEESKASMCLKLLQGCTPSYFSLVKFYYTPLKLCTG
eukprot:c3522_g1_i1 orf=188-340(+)